MASSAISSAIAFFAVVGGVAMNTGVVINEAGEETLLNVSKFSRAPKRFGVAYGV